MGFLNLPQIAENQAAAYVTSNDADAGLEKALCDCKLDHDASGGSFAMAEADFQQNWFHKLTGSPGADFDVTLPAMKRPFMVDNATSQTASFKTLSGASGHVAAGDTRLLYCDGTDVNSLTDDSAVAAAVPVFSGALMSLSSDESIANSTNTPLDWGTENYDTDGYCDLVSAPDRFTVPSGISKVVLNAQIRWDTNSTGEREILFSKDGVFTYAGCTFAHADARTKLLMNVSSPPIDVSAGETLGLVAWQNSGASRSIVSGNYTWFAIQAVG